MIIETGSDSDLKVLDIDANSEVIPQFSLDPTLYPTVSYLDLSFNRITSLSGLETYVNVETLILDNNCLSDDLKLPVMRRLRLLSLNKNYISDLDGLLEKLQMAAPKLVYLSLLSNTACPTEMVNSSYTAADYAEYRIFVLSSLPKLRFLDSQKVTREELNRATGRRSPSPGPLDLGAIEQFFPTQTWRREKSATGRAKYGKVLVSTFQGKNSEGNRFIRNRDL